MNSRKIYKILTPVLFVFLFFIIKNTKIFLLDSVNVKKIGDSFFSLNIENGDLKKIKIREIKDGELIVRVKSWGVNKKEDNYNSTYLSGKVVSENVKDSVNVYDNVVAITNGQNKSCEEYVVVKKDDILLNRPNFISDEQVLSAIMHLDQLKYILSIPKSALNNKKILITNPYSTVGVFVYSYFKDVPGIKIFAKTDKKDEISKLKTMGFNEFIKTKDIKNLVKFDYIFKSKNTKNFNFCKNITTNSNILEFSDEKSCEGSTLIKSSDVIKKSDIAVLNEILKMVNNSEVILLEDRKFNLGNYKKMIKNFKSNKDLNFIFNFAD